jgi:hypothetical protein
MAGRSPKQKDRIPKEKIKDQGDQKSDSDTRLIIVLCSAVILAIIIIYVTLLL